MNQTKRRCNEETFKFSVFWFYTHKSILPWIDLAALRCPYGGKIHFKFIKKASQDRESTDDQETVSQ
jgi:hypothetical protein